MVAFFAVYDSFYRPDNLEQYLSEYSLVLRDHIAAAPLGQAVVASIIGYLPFLAILYAYWRLSRLFVAFRNSEYFNEANARHLFVFAFLNFFGWSLSPLVYLLSDVIATYGTGIGVGLWLHIDGQEIPTIIFTGSFVLIAWILKEARKIAQENAEFV
jgi:hypothetical protein